MKYLQIVFLALCGLLYACTAERDDVRTIEPQTFLLKSQKQKKATILDVRRPEEYAAGHLHDAVNLDWLNTKAFKEGALKLDKSRTYFVYCRSGKRSHAAAEYLKNKGFKVYNLSGGYLNWTEKGLAIEK